jgi:phosphonate transport system substrate-binding protein
MLRCICFAALLVSNIVPSQSVAETLVFGVVPQQSAQTLAKMWVPVMDELSRATGKRIVFSTAKDIPTFEQRLANKEYDIAYMNPYHYVVYSETSGYRALAKQNDKQIQGIIVVLKDSLLTSLQDLDGMTLVFPAPSSFAASIIPQAIMKELGIKFTPKYVTSHDSVYLNVERKFSIAGGGVMRTLRSTPAAVGDNLKVLWRSNKFTPHAIASKAEMSDETRKSILDALLDLNEKPKHQQLLKGIEFKGFEAAEDNDWDDVRALKIATLLPAER